MKDDSLSNLGTLWKNSIMLRCFIALYDFVRGGGREHLLRVR
jgi:hypothetical protein